MNWSLWSTGPGPCTDMLTIIYSFKFMLCDVFTRKIWKIIHEKFKIFYKSLRNSLCLCVILFINNTKQTTMAEKATSLMAQRLKYASKLAHSSNKTIKSYPLQRHVLRFSPDISNARANNSAKWYFTGLLKYNAPSLISNSLKSYVPPPKILDIVEEEQQQQTTQQQNE